MRATSPEVGAGPGECQRNSCSRYSLESHPDCAGFLFIKIRRCENMSDTVNTVKTEEGIEVFENDIWIKLIEYVIYILFYVMNMSGAQICKEHLF